MSLNDLDLDDISIELVLKVQMSSAFQSYTLYEQDQLYNFGLI